MINNIWSIFAAFIINALLTAFSLTSYKYLLGVEWNKFIKRLGISIGVKFILLILLTIAASLVINIGNIYFVLSFSVFIVIQIILEIWYLVKLSKKNSE